MFIFGSELRGIQSTSFEPSKTEEVSSAKFDFYYSELLLFELELLLFEVELLLSELELLLFELELLLSELELLLFELELLLSELELLLLPIINIYFMPKKVFYIVW